MLATKVICPHCSKHLKTSKPLTVGHRVLCSRCGRSFAVRPDTINAAPVHANGTASRVADLRTAVPPPIPISTPQPPSLPHLSTDNGAGRVEAAPNGALASPPTAHRQALWIGVVFGGLLLLMGSTTALAVYFATRKDPQNVQTAPPASMQTEPEARVAEIPSPDNSRSLLPERHDDSPPPHVPRNDPPLLRDPPLLASPPPGPEQTAWLPPDEQEQVNKAIDRGVEWLKKHQTATGSWGPHGFHPVGLAALPALTLLECGVPAADPRIQKALREVRKGIPTLHATYELALAILFLDRLGDAQDEKLIQTCALRLVAGQSPTGGWTYNCPILKPEEERDLLTIMRQTRPTALDLFVSGPDGSAPPGFIAQGPRAPLDKTIGGDNAESKLLPPEGVKPIDKGPADSAAYKKTLELLPEHLRQLPALQPPEQAHKLPRRDGTDNSNTQFAILGLLAANRHNLPLDRTLALIVLRFRQSQTKSGGWNYHYASPPPNIMTPSMTGAGLLGLAVGHGLAADHAQARHTSTRFEDPAVEKGFAVLAQSIDKPLGAKKPRAKNRADVNLYFMWTMERCGVLYNRHQIGGKDWYQWGAELLVDHQKKDGSWMAGGYPGTMPITDTCFALLFLKRANLAKDLTKKLEFFLDGKKLKSGP